VDYQGMIEIRTLDQASVPGDFGDAASDVPDAERAA
jgi:hypothetical protein